MSPQNALEVLVQVANAHLCNAADRQVINNALSTLQMLTDSEPLQPEAKKTKE